jgi:hypothetical protein
MIFSSISCSNGTISCPLYIDFSLIVSSSICSIVLSMTSITLTSTPSHLDGMLTYLTLMPCSAYCTSLAKINCLLSLSAMLVASTTSGLDLLTLSLIRSFRVKSSRYGLFKKWKSSIQCFLVVKACYRELVESMHRRRSEDCECSHVEKSFRGFEFESNWSFEN